MSSPFEVFRRHQIMTVILIGLAMLSFVIFGAISDPRAIPAPLWVLAFASIVGGIAWVAGLKEKKQNEWGITGALAGVVACLAFMFANRPTAAVEIDGGGLTQNELIEKQNELDAANAFLRMVYAAASPDSPNMPPNYQLGLGVPQNEAQREQLAVRWELLSREADRLGIEISNDSVNEYLTEMTTGRVRRKHIKDARQRLRLPEPEIYRMLREGIATRTALVTLFAQHELPPQQYFDFYQRLNEQRSLKLIGLPVDDFVASVGEPGEAELVSFFEDYKTSRPNITPEGQFFPGRPGFFQPNKVQIAYAEFPLEAFKSKVDKPTDEEIQAEYDRRYKRELEAPPLPEAPPAPETPEAPAGDAANGEKPAGDAKMEEPAKEDSATAPEEPTTEKPAPEEPAGGKPAEAAKSEAASESPATGDKPAEGDSSAIPPRSELMPVVFLQEETPEEAAASDTPKEPAAPAEKVAAAEEAAKLPEVKPAESAAPKEPSAEKMKDGAEATEDGEAPPAPADAKAEMKADDADKSEAETDASSDEPVKEEKPKDTTPTLEEVRDEIVQSLIESRAFELQREAVRNAQSKLETLKANRALSEDDTSGLTPEQIAEQMQAWVEENGGTYGIAPMLSRDALYSSDDHPVGRAISGREGTVADVAIRLPQGQTLSPREAFDLDTQSSFVWWKVADRGPRVPESLDEPGIREQVVEAWKKQQAYPKAVARAEEIAAKITEVGVEGDLKATLAETTITDGGDYVDIKETGPVTWMSTSTATSTNPFAGAQADVTNLAARLGLPIRLGGDLFEKAFRELDPGEVGVEGNADRSVVYVVAVEPKEGESEDGPAEDFLKEPVFGNRFFSPYPGMAQSELQKFRPNVLRDLEQKYGVDFGS